MAKIWRSRDIIGAEDAQRWENKADATHRHKVADIDGLEAIIGNQTTNKANQADLTAHIQNKNNPHNVTKQQVGLGNVTNVEQASKQDFNNHATNRNNPHGVTKSQVGLGNVDNIRQASYTDHEATKREVNEQEQRLSLLEEMVLQNAFYIPIKAEDNANVLLGDENNNLVVADWKYQIVEREE